MEIEPPQGFRHDVAGEDADRQLVTLAQPLGKRGRQIRPGQAQFVGQFFCGIVEIGKMVFPTFDLAPGSDQRIVACVVHITGLVEQPRESRRRLRSCGKKFGCLVPVDTEICKTLVRQPAGKPVEAPDGLIRFQSPRVEVELLDELDDDARRDGPLVALDEVEVTGGYAEARGHGGLCKTLSFAEAAQGGACKKCSFAHLSISLHGDKLLLRKLRNQTR